MNKLLIGYDDSSCAKAALEELPRIGLPEQLQVRVLSVAEVWLPPEAPLPSTEITGQLPIAVQRSREAAWHAVEADSRHLAEAAARHLQELFPKWQIEAVAVGDSPGWGITSQAAEWGAALVVVGSHGRSAMERFFLGSVSHQVALEAPCSVHISRPRPSARAPRILVALDGSLNSLAAVRAVAERHWPLGAAFQILTLLDARLLSASAWPGPHTEAWAQPSDTTGTEWLERVQAAAAKELRAAGLQVETRLLEAEAKHGLLKHAEGWMADCIFLGAHGLHHRPRRTLGSISSAVATRAHCSVEIVRQQSGAG